MSVNMYFTFASLIVGAVMAMVQGGAAAIPPPLSRMRHALAGVHSYRVVQTSTQVTGLDVGGRSREMNGMAQRQTSVVIRHGTTLQTDVLITTTIQGRQQVIEAVSAGGKSCAQQGRLGSWHCIAASRAGGPTLTDLARLRWSPVPDRVIRGQRCRGYRMTRRPAAGAPRTRATL